MTEDEFLKLAKKVVSIIQSCRTKDHLRSAFALFKLWENKMKVQYGKEAFYLSPSINYYLGQMIASFTTIQKILDESTNV